MNRHNLVFLSTFVFVVLTLVACASKPVVTQQSAQNSAADRKPPPSARAPLPPMAEFPALENRKLIAQARNAVVSGEVPSGEQRLDRARAALDELATRGTGELYERVWMSFDPESFSAVQNSARKGRATSVGRTLGPRPLIQYRVLAYTKLESLAAGGLGYACGVFKRAYGRTPAGLASADISDVEKGFRRVARERLPVMGVAGHPKWDGLTWQKTGASPIKRGLPISQPAKYTYSGYAAINIPDAVIDGCANASGWSSLSEDDRRWVNVSEPDAIEIELDAIRRWAGQWRALKQQYLAGKANAMQLWDEYERGYINQLNAIAVELDGLLAQRGGSMNYDLGTALKRVDNWLGSRSRRNFGPERHILIAGGEYGGRQLVIGRTGMAKQAMRRKLAAEEAKLLKNGVVLSAQGTPIHFIAIAGQAFGKPLYSHSEL